MSIISIRGFWVNQVFCAFKIRIARKVFDDLGMGLYPNAGKAPVVDEDIIDNTGTALCALDVDQSSFRTNIAAKPYLRGNGLRGAWCWVLGLELVEELKTPHVTSIL